MDLPKGLIADSLKGFCVCYFKNSQHDPDAPPHYHLTIPINDDLSILFCLVTSQVENKAWYYKRTKEQALSSLVRVDNKSLPFLKKESMIDCNQPLLVRKNKLEELIDPKHKFEIKTREIPVELKERIVWAIKESPIVKPIIKKLINF